LTASSTQDSGTSPSKAICARAVATGEHPNAVGRQPLLREVDQLFDRRVANEEERVAGVAGHGSQAPLGARSATGLE
jgi:hypothetical protein